MVALQQQLNYKNRTQKKRRKYKCCPNISLSTTTKSLKEKYKQKKKISSLFPYSLLITKRERIMKQNIFDLILLN